MEAVRISLRISAFVVISLFANCLVRAQPATTQGPGTARLEFDVASVKPNTSDEGPRGISFSPSGRFAWNRMTLKQLIQPAYGEFLFKEIAGGPGWIDSARFDIAATSSNALEDMAPDGSPRGLFRRLRTLLEDRFALKTHIDQRPMSVYALEPVATPLVYGPGLKKTDIDCGAVTRDTAAGRRPAVAQGQAPPCSVGGSPGQVRGRAITLAQLISVLSGPTGRPVIDRTGLEGSYDVELRWAAEYPPGALLNGQPAPASTDGPSIFTAVREQLGLKLEPTRAEVPVLVIDSAQLPTPD